MNGISGLHSHWWLNRKDGTTEWADGEHHHVFRVPADLRDTYGDWLMTGWDGGHQHPLEGDRAVGGEHAHTVKLPDGTTLSTTSAEHSHALDYDTTAHDGAHVHTLDLNGVTLTSLTASQLWETIQQSGSAPAWVERRRAGRIERRTEAGVGSQLRIVRADVKRRLVTGAIFEPDRVDTYDTYVKREEVERVAHEFAKGLATGDVVVGLMHEVEAEDVSVVETWVSRVALSFGDEIIPSGSWLVTVHVDNDELWAAVEDGELDGFSFGGTGKTGAED